jgi:hypothetical protein
LAVSQGTSQLQLAPGAVLDLAFVPNLNMDQTLTASAYAEDLVSPSITTLAVDMERGLLCLSYVILNRLGKCITFEYFFSYGIEKKN